MRLGAWVLRAAMAAAMAFLWSPDAAAAPKAMHVHVEADMLHLAQASRESWPPRGNQRSRDREERGNQRSRDREERGNQRSRDREERGRPDERRRQEPGYSEQDRARNAVREGQALPLGSIIRRVESACPGTFLNAELQQRGQRLYYLVQVLSFDGRRRVVTIDAASGDVVGGGCR